MRSDFVENQKASKRHPRGIQEAKSIPEASQRHLRGIQGKSWRHLSGIFRASTPSEKHPRAILGASFRHPQYSQCILNTFFFASFSSAIPSTLHYTASHCPHHITHPLHASHASIITLTHFFDFLLPKTASAAGECCLNRF